MFTSGIAQGSTHVEGFVKKYFGKMGRINIEGGIIVDEYPLHTIHQA